MSNHVTDRRSWRRTMSVAGRAPLGRWHGAPACRCPAACAGLYRPNRWQGACLVPPKDYTLCPSVLSAVANGFTRQRAHFANPGRSPPAAPASRSAPELLLGRRCDGKADIYSFGVVLWCVKFTLLEVNMGQFAGVLVGRTRCTLARAHTGPAAGTAPQAWPCSFHHNAALRSPPFSLMLCSLPHLATLLRLLLQGDLHRPAACARPAA